MPIRNWGALRAISEHPDVLVIALDDHVMTSRVRHALHTVADAFGLTVVLCGGEPSAGANKVVGNLPGARLISDGMVVWVEPGSRTVGLLRALVEETKCGGALEALAFEPVDVLGPVVALVGDHSTAKAELEALDRENKVLATWRIEVTDDDADESDADIAVAATELDDFLVGLAYEIRN